MTGSTATTTRTICKPWKPFAYTSTNKASARYAGPKLAPELAVHNRTGDNLRCPDWR